MKNIKGRYYIVFVIISLFLITTVFGDSLWNKKDEEANSLFTYNNNFNIGDIVIIVVSENPSLSLSESMPNYKGSSTQTINSFVSSIAGMDLSKFLPIGSSDPSQISVQNNQVTSSSSAKVQLFISSIIVDKNENGLFKIRGEKEIKIGKNRNTIIVEGLISPKNIAKDGTVFSESIADAKIWYDGDIVFQQDPNEPSWLSSILSGIANIFF
ncbi:MAG TPA: flagellar basal body L-ring protein FlgH [Defluviitoga sp.]|nr:flagellar basal body L-ring protein FlgH [Defluviitoga sp.]HOP24647.1 flagellar basal body L-ring protein FlgH [Defluviitoga sp.]HPZ28850.1 flagellar basal body L-ring protein FlgH [Defluviitoga sp.]HQD62615.1 flagellar basal body L-ring protein FlgH [Defluviitoga sp.]